VKYFLPLILCACLARQPYTIWLYGDSISRGYGLADFDHPSPINSIWGIGNLLAQENGCNVVFRYAETQDAQNIWLQIQENTVKVNDIVIFENAGPHYNDLEVYRMWLKLVIQSTPNRKLYLATTPDNRPVGDASDYSAINPIVRQEAARLLDWEATFTPDLLLSDGVHFNAYGNFAAALSILRAEGVEIESYESVKTEFERQGLDAGRLGELVEE
jgi:hypothetical protein